MKFKRQRSARAGGRSALDLIRAQKGFVPFTGEAMVCQLCRREELSDPAHCKNWRCVVLDDHDRFYICSRCLPPAWASASAFSAVYVRACLAYRNSKEDFKPARSLTVWIEREGRPAPLTAPLN